MDSMTPDHWFLLVVTTIIVIRFFTSDDPFELENDPMIITEDDFQDATDRMLDIAGQAPVDTTPAEWAEYNMLVKAIHEFENRPL